MLPWRSFPAKYFALGPNFPVAHPGEKTCYNKPTMFSDTERIFSKRWISLELNKKNIKRILLLVACAILLYWGLNNLSTWEAC